MKNSLPILDLAAIVLYLLATLFGTLSILLVGGVASWFCAPRSRSLSARILNKP